MSVRHAWAGITAIVWTAFVVGIGVEEVDGGMSLSVLVPVSAIGVVSMLGSLMVTLHLWKPAPAPPARPTPARPVATSWAPVAPRSRPDVKPPAWSSADAVTRFMEPVRIEPQARPVAVAEPQPAPAADHRPMEEHLAGYTAGAHPEFDDGRRPDVEHLKGFAEGAVDRGKRDDED